MLLKWWRLRKKKIKAEDLHRRMAGGEKFTIIDVRTYEEYHGPEGRIPGALLIPVREFRTRGIRAVAESRLAVVILCSHGVRSMFALGLLPESDREVYSLEGGIRDWAARGFEVIRDSTAPVGAVPSSRRC